MPESEIHRLTDTQQRRDYNVCPVRVPGTTGPQPPDGGAPTTPPAAAAASTRHQVTWHLAALDLRPDKENPRRRRASHKKLDSTLLVYSP